MSALEPSELVVRAAALYIPVVGALALGVWRRPDRARTAAIVVTTVWMAVALLVVNVVAVEVGWWRFAADAGTVAGIPIDLWLGWAVLWGTVPLLLTVDRLPWVAVGLVAADLVLMPAAAPVVVLGDGWLVGELVAVAVVLGPGLALGAWTSHGRHLARRSLLQVIGFTGLTFYVLPSLVFTVTGEGWEPLLRRSRGQLVLAALLAAPLVGMALQAVIEFARAGGTPFPLDPPAALVVTGPYAYVANPMQLAGTLLLTGWGLLLSSWGVVVAAAGAAVFSAGFAAWDEDGDLVRRYSNDWHRYRAAVRLWWPSWRPTVATPAVVYAGTTCEPCREVGAFLARRCPIGLAVVAAETCPQPLTRITYRQGGRSESGVAAVVRSLEHVHLGWALVSWVARLPGVGWVVQLIADVVGAGPRQLSGTAASAVRDGS